MDALSQLLRFMRLQSSVYFRADFPSPWGMEIDNSPFAQFHLVVRGHCWLMSSHLSAPLALASGDVVVFPHGDEHWLADDPAHPRLPGKQVVQALDNHEQPFPGDKIATTLVCGHFEFNRNFDHPFVQALPKLIHIAATDHHDLNWLETMTRLIMLEANADQPGAQIVAERLAEALFIQVVRAYMQQQNAGSGFLKALQDRQISKALALLHAQPGQHWTLQALARAVGMSRSGFAARFKQLVGIPPMDYLTQWRMYKAQELLLNKQLPLVDIAEQVGYMSEAAFNRAFRRQFRQSPGAMRRSLP